MEKVIPKQETLSVDKAIEYGILPNLEAFTSGELTLNELTYIKDLTLDIDLLDTGMYLNEPVRVVKSIPFEYFELFRKEKE